MRIIAGDARGIRLAVPSGGAALRPTEDRVKESLFSTLGELKGMVVLDLFAGTGALGLEALSRGAGAVIFVERDPVHAAAIHENLAAVQKAILAAGRQPGDTDILVEDFKNISQVLDNKIVNIIIADPPYHPASGECGAAELLLDESLPTHCTPETLFALEHATDVMNLPWSPRSPWRLLRKRSFGIRSISYARLAADSSSESAEDFI